MEPVEKDDEMLGLAQFRVGGRGGNRPEKIGFGPAK